jgi:hypothetical protein
MRDFVVPNSGNAVLIKLIFHPRPFKFTGVDAIEMLGQEITAMATTIPFMEATVENLSITVDREAFELKHEISPPDEIHVFNVAGRAGDIYCGYEFHFKDGVLQQLIAGIDPEIKRSILARPITTFQSADE